MPFPRLVAILGVLCALPGTILMAATVTTSTLTGPGSISEAVGLVNSNPGVDTIGFEIPGEGPHRIVLDHNLFTGAAGVLHFTEGVILDGRTQPGYSGEPLVVFEGV